MIGCLRGLSARKAVCCMGKIYVENAFEYMGNVHVVQSRFGAKANNLVRLKKDTKRKVKIILKQFFCAFCNNRRGA